MTPACCEASLDSTEMAALQQQDGVAPAPFAEDVFQALEAFSFDDEDLNTFFGTEVMSSCCTSSFFIPPSFFLLSPSSLCLRPRVPRRVPQLPPASPASSTISSGPPVSLSCCLHHVVSVLPFITRPSCACASRTFYSSTAFVLWCTFSHHAHCAQFHTHFLSLSFSLSFFYRVFQAMVLKNEAAQIRSA